MKRCRRGWNQWSGRAGRWLAALVLGLSVTGLQAADRPDLKVDKTPIEREASQPVSYAPMVKAVAPSVVTIYSEHTTRSRPFMHPFMEDPFLRRFFGDNVPDQPRRAQGLGSGVIITRDGYILTNNHVVEGADKIMVVTGDGKQEFTARVVGVDPQTDVAVLKVEAKALAAVTFGDSDELEVGDVVFALGNPMGVGQTVSMGIISALGRGTGILGRGGYENFIQTDAAINRGNSGGPLVDVKGRLIGINQSIFSGSGGSDGIGFAVPVNLARNVVEQLIASGRVSRGYIGVNIQPLSPDLAQAFGIDDASGALVSEVVPGSPGDKAGLQPGDVIVQYDGRKVDDSAHLRLMASQTAPGTEVELKLVRDGKGRELSVRLGELPSELATRQGSPGTGSPGDRDSLDGVSVDDLTGEIRRQMGIPARIDGALVTGVEQGCNAFEAGLREGDVIVEINQKPVEDAATAVKLSEEARDERILLRVWSKRGGVPGLIYLVVDNTKTP
ncbi:MAG: Do family serine endopeptidase [Verrucomicrobia bacterium]|nr:Do family serine endopeptidase [Verrucomicrobiota bacterium]